jgi:chromosome segregation ATPase
MDPLDPLALRNDLDMVECALCDLKSARALNRTQSVELESRIRLWVTNLKVLKTSPIVIAEEYGAVKKELINARIRINELRIELKPLRERILMMEREHRKISRALEKIDKEKSECGKVLKFSKIEMPPSGSES